MRESLQRMTVVPLPEKGLAIRDVELCHASLSLPLDSLSRTPNTTLATNASAIAVVPTRTMLHFVTFIADADCTRSLHA